jgi:alpha-amylase
VPDYLNTTTNDLLGTDATHAQDNYVTSHPLYQKISELAAVTIAHPALRNGAEQVRYASQGSGVFAFSRLDRSDQREYVVALNNSETAQSAAVPTYVGKRTFELVYGDGPAELKTGADRTLPVTVPPLSAVVYVLEGRIPHSKSAPAVSVSAAPSAPARGRMAVVADVDGSSFYEVTFQRKVGSGEWQTVGTDDNYPYRVFDDVEALRTGTGVSYRAVVLDNGSHTAISPVTSATVPAPLVTIEAPPEGAKVRGTVEVRAVVDPERATHVVSFERQIADGAWTPIGSDSSSPAYTVFDDLTPLALAAGTVVRYRATVQDPDGTTATSPVRTVQAGGPPLAEAVVYYHRTAGDYGTPPNGWGLHMWGDAVSDAVLSQIAWDTPWQRSSVDGDWAVYRIGLKDDTKAVNFIMHLPSGDTVPTTREPGGDRSFVPLDHPAIWLLQGDPTVYTSQPAIP